LTGAHKQVTIALKNFLGTECMQRGQHKEAFSFFLEAAQAGHSPAIFNLGICYEMGLGTKQCFTKVRTDLPTLCGRQPTSWTVV